MKTFRLTKESRLRRTRDFERVRGEGRRYEGDLFLSVIAPNGLGFSRLGMAVPRRLGGAVQRNRIRRRIREGFRMERPGLPRGLDVVIIPGKGCLVADMAELRSRIVSVISKAGKELLK